MKHQFCDTIEMNNIFFVNICLLAIVAMVCSHRPLSDENYPSNQPIAAGAHVSLTENRLRSWSRTITRNRRDADKSKNHSKLYVIDDLLNFIFFF